MKDYYWLNSNSRTFLKRGYLKEGVSAEERILEIAQAAEKILKIEGFAEKFQRYMSQGFYSLSTPVWSNFGLARGFPVSCFGSYVNDTMEDILSKLAEVGAMSKGGGGTSGYFGDLRPRGAKISVGGESSGPVHFLELFDVVTDVVSQGSTRRGNFAAYMNVEHPDLEEFLRIGVTGHPIQNIKLGVTISDKWMDEMLNDDKKKKKIWGWIIKKRFEKGFPYICFIDTINKSAPQVYKDKGKEIKSQNLCAEICLSSSDSESFVCVLSSLNLERWEELVETDAIETMVYFLDAVNEEFVRKSEGVKFMECAHKFAKEQRALGMGVLGWHSSLQAKMIPFESMEAKLLNNEIWKTIKNRSDKATAELAEKYGEPELLKGYGRRNTTLLAVAPTMSSSFILGQVSLGIEPLEGNYIVENKAKGTFPFRNYHFKNILKKYDKDNETTWKSILVKGGSVQHLKFLSDDEKEVFKTFSELSQKEIIIQAAQRQKYIDQGQSLNITVSPDANLKEVSSLMIDAWKLGVKSLYYQRSTNPSQQLARSLLTCTSCEG